MAESILKLRVDSQEYDNKLKRASDGLQRYIEGCRKAGGTLEHLDDGVEDFTKSLGNMGTMATGAKGKLNEMTKTFTDLSMEYKQLTDQEKAAPFGKALSASLDQLQGRIQQTKADLNDINSKLSGAMPEAGGGLFSGDKFSGMLQVFGGNLMTKGADMLAGLASEMGDMVKQGIELAKQGEGIRIAFERLGRGDILQGLREATHGTVTDLELMKAAVKFNDFKLPLDELGTMLAFAQQKAKDTGQSVDYMVDSIVTGLGRKSLMILDNLGLSAAQIKEKMAETGDMTKAVGAIIREEMSKAGDYVETAADRATQANVNLQNKMEELGRKFAPLEEASNNFWTSMKIGILDVVGGPLTNLLNKLTEAGRLMGAYGKLGGNTKVNRMIANLAGARQENRQSIYQQQQSEIWKYINPREQQLKDIRAWQRGERNDALKGRIQSITAQYGSLDATKIQAEVDAAKKMLSEYQQAARSLLTPVKADINTDDAQQSVASLTKKLKELQEQRKKAIAAGDTDLSKNLQKQINQVKADIKGLGGTTTTTTAQNPQQQAAKKVSDAEFKYQQSLDEAALQLKAGTITEADQKKKELQAREQLWKALGDAYNTYADPNIKKAQQMCADEIEKLGGEVNSSIEAQKKQQEAIRQLEQAEKKVADAMEKSADAWRKGDLQGYMQAQKSVGGDVSPAIGSEAFSYTSGNLDAFVGNLKQKLNQAEVGSTLYNNLTAQLADANALGNLIQTAIKNGIDVAEFNPQELWSKVFGDNPGDYISDETWENIRMKIEEIIGKPIKLNLKTGETTSSGRSSQKNNPYLKTREDGKTEASIAGVLGGLGSGMSQMVNGIEQLGIDVPEGLKNALNAMQGISTILTGIATTVLAIEAIAGADAIIPFAHGGIVKAFSGTLVGNTYSGDQLRGIDQSGQLYGLNAGEVVLNRAQVGNLASQLSGGLAAMQLSAIITGEQLRLVLNNNGRRTGRGEYVTTNFR